MRGMTTSPPLLTSDSYTPLERLLLFQSLHAYGVDHAAFSQISDSLRNNPVIRDAPAFEPVRLRPAELKDVYLRLLKDELRHEIQETSPGEVDSRNGDGDLGSRKRKAPSPHLPSVHEAAQHAHLVPQLIAKLYARYQEQIIREIREEEGRYARLQGEIKEIENGAWDERIGPGDVPPVEKPLDRLEGQDDVEALPNNATAELPAPGATVEQPSRAEQDRTRQSSRGATSIDALINHPISEPEGHSANGSPYAPASGPNLTSTNRGLPYAPSSHHRLPSQPFPNSPRLPAPLSSGPGYGLTSPLQQSPHGSNHPPPVFPSAPALQSRHVGSAELPSASSRILPPPPGMQIPSHNGVALPPSQFRGPQHRAPSAPSPPLPYNHSSERYPMPMHAPQRGIQSPLPSSRAPLPPQQNYYAHPGRTPYPPYAPPSHHPRPPPYYPPRQGGIMLPPFQVTPQEPNRASQQSLQQASIATQTRAPARAFQPAEGSAAPPPSLTARVQQPVPSDLRKSIPRPEDIRQPPRPLRLTVYKSQSLSPALQRPQSPDERPDPEALSPQLLPSEILRPLSPPRLVPPQDNDASAAGNAVEATATAGESRQATPDKVVGKETDAGSTSGGRQRIRRRRRGSRDASSTITSTAGRRTRSQSVALAAEEPSVDNDTSSAREVKPEPSTPAPISEEAETGEIRERSTVRHTGELAQIGKRKRKPERGSLAALDAPEPPGFIPPATPNRQYILCSRNFHKMSQPIMHDIQSHKHGSLFSNPVKEKDAQGYADIIRRPQDLKSIRAAIAAGGRAVAAAALDTPQGSPGGVAGRPGGNVLLPVSPDLVPPKGIVNSAQLEKELMRMFANAIMFNPGDEGVVQDAREMFRTTVRTVESWRSAERPQSAEDGRGGRWEDEVDELAGEEGVVEEGGRKRRRV